MVKFDKKRLIYMCIALFALILSIANCIGNIIVLNIFSLVIDLIFVCMICFALGYVFCQCEMTAKVVEKPTEEKEEIFIEPTDKDLTQL